MNVLITGSTGLIGRNLTSKLLDCGFTVTTLAKNSVSEFPVHKHYLIDINSNEAQVIAKGSDAIIHLAGLSDVSASKNDVNLYARINTLGTVNMLEAARMNNCHFILASSQRIYTPSKDKLTENSPKMPVDPYGYSKLAAELWAKAYAHLYNLPVTILRFFSVYGPGQRVTSGSSGVVAIFVKKALNDEPIEVKSDALRDFIYVSDVVEAIKIILNRGQHKNEMQIYNIGTGQPTSILSLAKNIKKITQSNSKIIVAYGYDSDSYVANIDKFVKSFNFIPSTTLNEGLEKYVEFIKNKT